MASHKSPGRILGIDDVDTSAVPDENKKIVASKPCVVPGCSGTMLFHERQEAADAPHTLEWPWYASWRCAKDPTHYQLIRGPEERELRAKVSATSDRLPLP